MYLKLLFTFSFINTVLGFSVEFCGSANASCFSNLWKKGVTNNYCFTTVDRTHLKPFEEKLLKNSRDRLYIKLTPVEFVLARTVFNVTISDITCNRIKFRFSKVISNDTVTVEYFINGTVPKDEILVYDCPWTDAEYENKVIEFEYAYGIDRYEGKRTFKILVPFYEEIDNFNSYVISKLKLFLYVETTDLYNLVLKLHTPPNYKNISYYNVTIEHKIDNFSEILGPFCVKAENAIKGVISFSYYTSGSPGEYTFFVRPFCDISANDLKVITSKSAPIIIPRTFTPILIGIVGISCMIPILLITCSIWLRKYPWEFLMKRKSEVLLVATPPNEKYKNIGLTLAKILEKDFNIKVSVVDLEIPVKEKNKRSKNSWLRKSYLKSTHIVFLLSNNDTTDESKQHYSADTELINMINKKLLKEKKYCLLTFPFSSWDVNATLMKVQNKFSCLTEFRDFINFLHNENHDSHKIKYNSSFRFVDLITAIKSELPVEMNEFCSIQEVKNNEYIQLSQNNSNINHDVQTLIEDDFNIYDYNLFGAEGSIQNDNHDDNDSDIEELINRVNPI